MNRATWMRRLPWSIVLIAAALALVGCLGIARASRLADDSPRYVVRQAIWCLICLVAMLAVSRPNYRVLARLSYVAFALALLMLVVVYFCEPINGARRWIRLGPIGLQPSEFAKLAFVLALARYLSTELGSRNLLGLLAPLGLALVPMLLILKEPDLGTSLVFLPVLFVVLHAAGVRRGHLALLALAALASMPLVWSQMSREQKSRITALAAQTTAGQLPSDDGFHLHQAKQVMSLGGWTGSYLGGQLPADRNSRRLPEARTDSIAIVLAERFGLVGWSVILVLFWLLIWRGLEVAAATREPFGRLAAIGIMALISTQVIINTGMLVGLLPITGLTLPLVSYGGSSLLANSLALGLVLNIGLRPGYEVTNEPFRMD